MSDSRRTTTAPPSWRRLLVGTTCAFAAVLAFLAGRVQAGSDPALGSGGERATANRAAAAPRSSSTSGAGTGRDQAYGSDGSSSGAGTYGSGSGSDGSSSGSGSYGSGSAQGYNASPPATGQS